MQFVLKQLMLVFPLLIFLTDIGTGQVAKEQKDEDAFSYKGEVKVEYMPTERFTVLRRNGRIKKTNQGYVRVDRKTVPGKAPAKHLVHTDLEKAVKSEVPDSVSKEKIYILYSNGNSEKKDELPEIELRPSDIKERQELIRVEKGKVELVK